MRMFYHLALKLRKGIKPFAKSVFSDVISDMVRTGTISGA